jgi:hypothetical protein
MNHFPFPLSHFLFLPGSTIPLAFRTSSSPPESIRVAARVFPRDQSLEAAEYSKLAVRAGQWGGHVLC